jgi:hypothetical protein
MKGSKHEDGRASRQARHSGGPAGNSSVCGMADERAVRQAESQTAGGLAVGQAGEVQSRTGR